MDGTSGYRVKFQTKQNDMGIRSFYWIIYHASQKLCLAKIVTQWNFIPVYTKVCKMYLVKNHRNVN